MRQHEILCVSHFKFCQDAVSLVGKFHHMPYRKEMVFLEHCHVCKLSKIVAVACPYGSSVYLNKGTDIYILCIDHLCNPSHCKALVRDYVFPKSTQVLPVSSCDRSPKLNIIGHYLDVAIHAIFPKIPY